MMKHLVVVTALLVCAQSRAGDASNCAHPKAAVLTWLANLQPENMDVTAAMACTPQGTSLGMEERQRAVVRLKRVLDARGIFVRVDDLPEDPDYRDDVLGQHRVVLSPLLPELVVVKAGSRWVLSEGTLGLAEELFRSTFPFDPTRIVEELPRWLQVPFLGLAGWQLIGFVLLVLCGLLARLLVANVVTAQVLRVFQRLQVEWGRDLIRASTLPLGTLSFAGTIWIFVPSLGLHVAWAKVVLLCMRVIAAVSCVVLVYRLVDIVAAFLQHRAERTETKLDDQLVPLVRRGLRIVTVLAGVVFVLQNLEINVGSLLATLGIGTLAFALAAQDTVKNLFGSITIFLDKPFQIGDWVVTSGVEGVIHEVGFRSTQIRTFYDSVVTIPNGKFTDAIIDNYGKRRYRRCFTKLGLAYHTTPEQMEAFCNGVRAIISAHPSTRKDYYEVHFSGYGESGLEVMLYFFFEVPSWTSELRARHEVFLDIWRLAHHLRVSFAFPTRTLHVDSLAVPTPHVDATPMGITELEESVASFAPGGRAVVTPGPRVGRSYTVGEPAPSAKKPAVVS
ncbi:MAG: mechanosensitive ion channel family protein [Myxococcota bacterium]